MWVVTCFSFFFSFFFSDLFWPVGKRNLERWSTVNSVLLTAFYSSYPFATATLLSRTSSQCALALALVPCTIVQIQIMKLIR